MPSEGTLSSEKSSENLKEEIFKAMETCHKKRNELEKAKGRLNDLWEKYEEGSL